MNVLISLAVVIVAILVTIDAVPEGGAQFEQKHFWTPCVQDYSDPRGACHSYGFSVTKNPDGGYTKARQVNHWWSGGENQCSDAPKRVRFFCAKKYTKAYWAGTAPLCGSKSSQEKSCRDRGYEPTDFTSDYGDGHQCSWGGTKVLCAKE